jgi:hypothetical protein
VKRFTITVEWGEVPPDPPLDREGSADALVERSDPHAPPIGFYPQPRPEETM